MSGSIPSGVGAQSISKIVTVVIPTLNGEHRLPTCLRSLIHQTFAREEMEIIVIDDLSSDKTVEVCKEFEVDLVLQSGKRSIEYSKFLGLINASGKYLLFLDDDNELISNDWIKTGVQLLESNPSTGSFQSFRYFYSVDMNLINRYNALIGANDPIIFLMGKSDKYPYFEDFFKKKNWIKSSRLLDTNNIAVRCEPSKVPTFGSNGFMTPSNLLKGFQTTEYFYHLDYCLYLNETTTNEFILSELSTAHYHSESVRHFVKKCRRNARIFLDDRISNVYQREYNYSSQKLKIVFASFLSLTLIFPTYQAFRGFLKIQDRAWFLHPVLCFIVTSTYSFSFCTHLFRVVVSKVHSSMHKRIESFLMK